VTDLTTPAGDRIEPVGLEVEMQRSYLDYAMSVIVARALPDVRDGLKPVHRRVLYAMYDGGYRPDRGYFKCARVVGEVMGNYHPHGDSAIYDTLVRLAQPWALRYPLVDGNGNFGSPGNDPAAAMRYCVAPDTLLRLADGQSVRIGDVVPDARPNSDNPIDLKVLGRHGDPVEAQTLFHSGEHQTLRLTTMEGYQITGTHNHPVLCLISVGGVPTLLWKLLDEIRPGDRVVLQRTPRVEWGAPSWSEAAAAIVFGAFVSEGFVSKARAGFNNTDAEFFSLVLRAYDAAVGGARYVSSRTIKSGSTLYELDVQDLAWLQRGPLAELSGQRSAEKSVPQFVWQSSVAIKRLFLEALFTGDGSASALPRRSVQISYSTRSERLAIDVQQLLLEFGVVSRRYRHATGEHKVVITNRRDAWLFASRVGFFGCKQNKLVAIVDKLPVGTRSMSGDHVPGLAAFLREYGSADPAHRRWLARNNIDRLERWEDGRARILGHLTDPDARQIAAELTDGRFYYAEVESVADAGVQPVYSLRVNSEDHAFVTNGFVSHNTECRMAPLAMEMVRGIDQDTVDFGPNYDGRSQEPVVLPSRLPNLLVNGSSGIAVGMATSIPPHNLREVAAGIQWYLDHFDAGNEELLAALMERIPGPDFPTAGLIVGRRGIEDAYHTGRGAITMRAVVDVEEIHGRTCLVVTELPYQVNPDNLALKIAELVKDGRVQGIADVKDETSARTGQRLVIVLKQNAVAKVVLNNLYKHTQLQDTFGANMLALVDAVPRTLRLDEFVRYYVDHQLEVVQRRTRYLLREAEKRAHILRGLLKALDQIDEVIALIRRSQTVDVARTGLMDLLDIDEVQANAILDMQLRRLAALERQKLLNEYSELEAKIVDYNDILGSPTRQRQIISEELADLVARFGDERRTKIIPYDGDVTAEDLIAEEDIVVTITRGGYAKRTKADLYRSQKRGGKGVRGAALRQDDIVEHFFVTTTHHWLLFFTNKGRVYRAKAYELPDAGRDARGQHVANLLAFQPDERIAQVFDLRDYQVAPYLILATRAGLVKKTKLEEYDSPRIGGIIAINLREDDELISAQLVSPDDDLLLVSRKAMAIRFTATDEQLRPMGRATSGVIGMRFRDGDELLSMDVVRPGADLVVATGGGYIKRTKVEEYRRQGRGGYGIIAARVTEDRGNLVGSLIVHVGDEVLAITSSGGVIRTRVTENDPRITGRDTMGVRLINVAEGDSVVAIARNAEAAEEVETPDDDVPPSRSAGETQGEASGSQEE
jgi:DNA gyrase subunit A